MKKNVLRAVMLSLMMMTLAVTPMQQVAYADSPSHQGRSDVFIDDMSVLIDDVQGYNAKTQAVVNYVFMTYSKGNKRFKGKGQCYGYAEKIRKMFGSKSKQKKIGIRPTGNNIYKYLKSCRPGTHVRFSAKKKGGGRAHSVALLKVTKNYVWFTDGNMDWKNGIRVDCCSLTEFASWARSYGYLAWVKKPKGSPTKVKKLDVKASSGMSGNNYVAWRPVKKAKKYVIYRSTSKSSGYQKIATVKAARYIDRSAPLGTVYYKVKAKGKTSKAVSAQKRLSVPVVNAKVFDAGDPRVELSWNAVTGANRYKVKITVKYENGGRDQFNSETTATSLTFRKGSKVESVSASFIASNGNSAQDSLEADLYYDMWDGFGY